MPPVDGEVFNGGAIPPQKRVNAWMSSHPRQLYEFGPYRIDIGWSRLERAGAIIPVRPKTFDLLVLLARNVDRVLSKAELMEALWPQAFVEDANLTQHVYTLRKVLGDRPDGDPYIENVPRRGYRLNADIREVVQDIPPLSRPQPSTTTFSSAPSTPRSSRPRTQTRSARSSATPGCRAIPGS
jgi:DNA-binding winged helix-turn-helix (wHTH) protein